MRGIKIILVTAAVGLVLPASSALAAADDTQIQLNAGSLSYTTPFSAENFPDTGLTGLPQAVRASVNQWKVTDARGGLLNGWNVTVAASQFLDNNGTTEVTTDDKTLPAGSLALLNTSLNLPTISTTSGNLSLPPVSVPVTLAIDGGGAAQKLVTAAVGQGLGEWTFAPANAGGGDLVLTVPADAQPGTYVSTITTTLATGP